VRENECARPVSCLFEYLLEKHGKWVLVEPMAWGRRAWAAAGGVLIGKDSGRGAVVNTRSETCLCSRPRPPEGGL